MTADFDINIFYYIILVGELLAHEDSTLNSSSPLLILAKCIK